MIAHDKIVLESNDVARIEAHIKSIDLASWICKINIARGIDVEFCQSSLDEHNVNIELFKTKLAELKGAE